MGDEREAELAGASKRGAEQRISLGSTAAKQHTRADIYTLSGGRGSTSSYRGRTLQAYHRGEKLATMANSDATSGV